MQWWPCLPGLIAYLLPMSACCHSSGSNSSSTDAAAPASFAAKRKAFATNLQEYRRAPQESRVIDDNDVARLMTYTSGDMTLKALFAKPAHQKRAVDGKAPLIVYFHGGFALGPEETRDVDVFRRDGFAVFAPSYRGENDNPGVHELWFGEVDDARAAVKFASTIDGVDPNRIVLWGHSAGGNISGLLALDPDVKVVDTGSVGATYTEEVFDRLYRPFEDTPQEREMRVWLPHWRELAHKHFTCIGKKDGNRQMGSSLLEEATKADSKLTLREVDGDHFTSLPACTEAFRQRVVAGLGR